MSTAPLNLASRPFRNERLPSLLLALGFTVAAVITVKHAIAIRALLPGRTWGLSHEVSDLEEERARLRAETARIRAPRPEQSAVSQWAMLKELVDRRTFYWSGLFAVLEETLPRGVRVISLSPSVKDGQMNLDLQAVARSNDDVFELIRTLEERPEFEDVLPRNRTGEGELSFRVTMKYIPSSPPPAVAAASVAAPPATSPEPPPAASSTPPAAVTTGPPAAGPQPSPAPAAAPARRPSPMPREKLE